MGQTKTKLRNGQSAQFVGQGQSGICLLEGPGNPGLMIRSFHSESFSIDLLFSRTLTFSNQLGSIGA